MTDAEKFKITSNDFADLIIEYNRNHKFLEPFTNDTIHKMNGRYAVVYVPSNQLTNQLISRYGFSGIPSCFTLLSEISLRQTGVERIRNLPNFNLRGSGVLIGIADTGIDYTHPAFLNADGSSRIRALWDQTVDSNQYPKFSSADTENTYYGTEYTQEQINQALANPVPLSVVPSVDEIGHGTALAGIAAGTENTNNDFSGVVPNAELVVVKLKQAKKTVREFFLIPDNVPCYQENDIMWAIQYLIDTAQKMKKPMAIILGLVTSLESHSGRSSLGDMLTIGSTFEGIALSVAVGYEGLSKRHFFSTVSATQKYTLVEINVGENEDGFVLTLWGAAPNTYSIDIVSPYGEYIQRIPEYLYVNRDISFIFEKTKINVIYQMVESQTADQLIMLRFLNPTAGIWRLKVYSRGDLEGSFHIWLPSGAIISNNTYFINSYPYTTITGPSDAPNPIAVTAYDPENESLFLNAGRGYTTKNAIKPELAAPGVNILCPSVNNHDYMRITGTGAAAAYTAGIAAMLLEWGNVRGLYPSISTTEIKRFLVRGAKRKENVLYPNREWGYGMVNIDNVFNVLRTFKR